MSKKSIFNKGVERTHWKSVMNSKLNPLRQELSLKDRPAPLKKGQYDKEALDAVAETDFSELDTNFLSSWFCFVGLSNTIKYVVVNCAGCGLEGVDEVGEESIPLKDHMD